ncbi:MAG: hypothetical protein COV71_00880 [Candidatus Omnitrophica bacterium CG11_big_fil_rev_8_21_14_0_20_41_12]|nr:MAG: hypothetical protein COV71_00880 [Candidatus Omnitrophica bacterium CG11_big_fil_rev_8_21_14_0_20_41_12]
MNAVTRVIFISTIVLLTAVNVEAAPESGYSNNENKVPQVLFFPKETALKDGSRISPDEWTTLDAGQKKIFIIEGIQEIKNRENCTVKEITDMPGLMEGFDKAVQILAAGGTKTAIIAVLFRMLGYGGDLECDRNGFIAIKERIMSNRNNIVSPTVELAKTYSGYTDFYEKDGNWFMEEKPPSVGEILKKHFIYSNYTGYPSGMVILSGNYPLEFDYRIISIKEINSFLQNDGLMTHYYEVTFECEEK